MPNWAKMIDFLTCAVKAISTHATADTNALRSTGPYPRSYKTSVHEVSLETQRERAMANLRANLNR
jgi:hypothetical protein